MRAVSLLLGTLLIACGGDTSASSADAGHLALDAAQAAPATFSEIYAALFPATTDARCDFCHSMRASETSNGKLSMGATQAAAYAALVGVTSTSTQCGGMTLVDPSSPDTSLLLLKLLDPPPCGSRMPLGGAALSNEQLVRVRSWIAAGANND